MTLEIRTIDPALPRIGTDFMTAAHQRKTEAGCPNFVKKE